MNRYAPSRPRATFAMIATALAALNFAVLVALPAAKKTPDKHPTTKTSNDEPHVDSGTQELERARAVRERRHDLVARAIGSAARASDRLWARSPD